LKNATVLGILGVCKKQQKSQWTRLLNFAQTWRALQEAKPDRATFASMTASGNAIAVASVVTRLALGEER
jgi:hypothetical protein